MVAVDHKLKPSFFLCDSFVLISIISDTLLLLVSLTRDAIAARDHDVIEIIGDTLAKNEYSMRAVETGCRNWKSQNSRVQNVRSYVHVHSLHLGGTLAE